jgi:hypothetical protein
MSPSISSRPNQRKILHHVISFTIFNFRSGYSASQLVRDKFLVMACTVDGETLTTQQLAEVWKVFNS